MTLFKSTSGQLGIRGEEETLQMKVSTGSSLNNLNRKELN